MGDMCHNLIGNKVIWTSLGAKTYLLFLYTTVNFQQIFNTGSLLQIGVTTWTDFLFFSYFKLEQ
jgi:hypothetical protein